MSRQTTKLGALVQQADVATPWLIDGLMIEDEQSLWHGREYSGKSYIVLDLGLHVAAGMSDWHGFPIPKQRPVLYVPSEGIRGVNRRLQSWVHWHLSQGNLDHLVAGNGLTEDGIPLTYADVVDSIPFERYDGPLYLDASKDSAKKTVAALADAAQEMDAGLVIIDVLRDFTVGVEENSSAFGDVFTLLKPANIGCAVLVVHHEGFNDKGRSRGHSSQLGAVDLRVAVEVGAQDNEEFPTLTSLKVTCKKQKNEDTFQPFSLRLERPDENLQTPLISGLDESQTALQRYNSKATGSLQVHSDVTDKERIWFTQVYSSVNQGGISPQAIREATGLGKSTESKIRKRLEEQGFVANIGRSNQPLMVTTAQGVKAVLG